MPLYDFNKILSFSDFECLVRDLLQKQLNIHLECFTEGRDGGIDLRCSTNGRNGIIIQAKRYQDFKSLMTELKKEVEKVKRLNPKRYIIATSVGLTPGNKEKIVQLFTPYIHHTEDIYGRDDLNNLLGKFPEVENGFPKLWLSSAAVLDRIVNASVVNQSKFEWEQIREEIETYVVNDSVNKAQQILKDNGYVIISGIPGIGKTTLARFLVYTTLGTDEEYEFVSMSCIEDGLNLYKEGKKQIFLYDDFLGSNVFIPESHNYDGRLINFINAIKRSPDKRFILTTREYILKDAQRYYEKIKRENFDLAKCILELGDYTTTIRARILYNHIAKENLEEEYLNNIIKNRSYRRLINHPNFNPRILETYIHGGLWKQTPASEFVNEFVRFFDSPYSVWESAFDKLLYGEKIALCVLSMLDLVVTISDWRRAFLYVCENDTSFKDAFLNEHEWLSALKKLENCFIFIVRHNLVRIHNPSVKDFIADYLENHIEIFESLIRGAIYTEQLHISNAYMSDATKNNHIVQSVLKDSFMRIANSPQSCGSGYKDAISPKYDGQVSMGGFLLAMIRRNTLMFRYNPGLLEEYISDEIFLDQEISLQTKIELAENIDWRYIKNMAKSDLFYILEAEDKTVEDYVDYAHLVNELDIIDTGLGSEFVMKLEDTIDQEIEQLATNSEVEQFEDSLNEIRKEIPISDYSMAIDKLKSKLEQDEPDYDRDYFGSSYSSEKEDSDVIHSMFTSLLKH